MGVLEQITQMKNQGIPDNEIIRNLQEQGVSPKEINDALNQAQIKNAVNKSGDEIPQEFSEMPPQQNQGNYAPQTQEMPEQEMYSQQPAQEYAQQDQYSQQGYSYPSERADSDMIIEIAEQVFSEKIKKMQKQTEENTEFKALAQTKIDNVSERLKRIETMIDKLQITILEKVGSYGNNLENIKKEMSMMQDSFGKVVNKAVKAHKSHSKKK